VLIAQKKPKYFSDIYLLTEAFLLKLPIKLIAIERRFFIYKKIKVFANKQFAKRGKKIFSRCHEHKEDANAKIFSDKGINMNLVNLRSFFIKMLVS
jgi:hypothetical protein